MRPYRAYFFVLMTVLMLHLQFPADLYAGNICDGLGNSRVGGHVHFGTPPKDDLVFLLLLSSTSTTIYCITHNEEREKRRYSLNLENYSETNFAQLMEEGAKGGGEHLIALSALMGCPPKVQRQFFSAIQENYKELFSAKSTIKAETFLPQLTQLIQDNPTLFLHCQHNSQEQQ